MGGSCGNGVCWSLFWYFTTHTYTHVHLPAVKAWRPFPAVMGFVGISHSGVEQLLEGSGSGDGAGVIQREGRPTSLWSWRHILWVWGFFSLPICFWGVFPKPIRVSLSGGKNIIKQHNQRYFQGLCQTLTKVFLIHSRSLSMNVCLSYVRRFLFFSCKLTLDGVSIIRNIWFFSC